MGEWRLLVNRVGQDAPGLAGQIPQAGLPQEIDHILPGELHATTELSALCDIGPAHTTQLPVRAAPGQPPVQRPRRQRGLRFSRKAFMPSRASGSWLVAAMTSTA